ncbi:MAG TPA: PilZ domain-containing protein [Vicinamibacterales bacterium]|nr:PilZ domain-containing protein [Vicinamibacterales bacterium]
MPHTPQAPGDTTASFHPEHDRRRAPRFPPDAVPWLREVKPISGDSARLLNISRSGVLLETTARLQPGRKSTVILINDVNHRQSAEGRVVRTELVAVGKKGELIYRTALAFLEELDLRLPGLDARVNVPVGSESCVQSQLDGPLTGLWSSSTDSRRVEVTHVTATGCYVRSPGVTAVDERASVTLFFTPERSLLLRGTVAAVEPGRGCLLRFEDLPAETRRALRLEIREGISRGASAPPQPVAVGTLVEPGTQDAGILVEWHARAGAAHANQW